MEKHIHVEPQDSSLRNSPSGSREDAPSQAADAAGETFCYWNDKKYSDGATICESHRRMECWKGNWVDVGNC